MFKNFRIDEVFVMKRGKEAAPNRVPDGSYNMVNETSTNNGITKKAYSENVFDGNSITVSVNYATTVFYQPAPYCASVNILILENDNLDAESAMYVVAMLRKNNEKYDYNNKISKDRLAETVLPYPVIENPNPDHEYTVDDIDWQYMHDYITELERDRITELDAYLQATGLNDYELTEDDKKVLSQKVDFMDVLIGKLFNKVEAKCKKADFDKRKDTSTIPSDEFCIPLINAKLGDNGIMFYGRKEDWDTQSMCIDVIQNGAVATGKVYVQPQSTAVLWDAYLIQPIFDNATEYNLLYLARCIEKLTKERFSYEKKATWDRIKECFITIPIKSDKTPDFDYMERYIRAMEKVVIADVVKYKDKVIETTKQIANE